MKILIDRPTRATPEHVLQWFRDYRFPFGEVVSALCTIHILIMILLRAACTNKIRSKYCHDFVA
jgi:hypothetical protein